MATGEPRVRPWRTPADQGQPVLLEAHARTPAEPEAPAGQLGLDLLDRDRQAGGQALDDDDQALAVGLAGGEEAQHARDCTGRLHPTREAVGRQQVVVVGARVGLHSVKLVCCQSGRFDELKYGGCRYSSRVSYE